MNVLHMPFDLDVSVVQYFKHFTVRVRTSNINEAFKVRDGDCRFKVCDSVTHQGAEFECKTLPNDFKLGRLLRINGIELQPFSKKIPE